MPITQSSKKSLRVAERNHKVNVTFKTNLRAAVKEYIAKPSVEGLKKVYSMLDKAVKNNIFHQNKSDRLKANYNKLANGKVAQVQVKKAAKKKGQKKKTAKNTAKKMK